jgi:hypothetical protein
MNMIETERRIKMVEGPQDTCRPLQEVNEFVEAVVVEMSNYTLQGKIDILKGVVNFLRQDAISDLENAQRTAKELDTFLSELENASKF